MFRSLVIELFVSFLSFTFITENCLYFLSYIYIFTSSIVILIVSYIMYKMYVTCYICYICDNRLLTSTLFFMKIFTVYICKDHVVRFPYMLWMSIWVYLQLKECEQIWQGWDMVLISYLGVLEKSFSSPISEILDKWISRHSGL